MSLLFGRLTQNFVEFGTTLNEINMGNQTAVAALPAAAEGFRKAAALNASYLTYIGAHPFFLPRHLLGTKYYSSGVGMFCATFVYMYTWVYTGEINAKRLRERYLQAVLRQDIAYFDNVGAGEVATRIQTDTRASKFPRPCIPDVVLTHESNL